MKPNVARNWKRWKDPHKSTVLVLQDPIRDLSTQKPVRYGNAMLVFGHCIERRHDSKSPYDSEAPCNSRSNKTKPTHLNYYNDTPIYQTSNDQTRILWDLQNSPKTRLPHLHTVRPDNSQILWNYWAFFRCGTQLTFP